MRAGQGQADADGSAGAGVAGGVGARATVQRVVAQAAFEHIGAGAAGEGVVEVAAGEVLDADQVVRTRATGGLWSGDGQADADGAASQQVRGGVAAGATVQQVDAGAGEQHVVERIAVAVGVAAGDDAQVLDVGREHIAAQGPDFVDAAGGGFDDGAAAVDDVDVVAVAAAHRVVAQAAVDHVGVGVAGQRVGKVAADQVLDADQRVGAGTHGVLCARQRQAHRHCGRRRGIGRRVAASAAVQRVVAGTALEHVVGAIAGQRVVEGAAPEVFDADQRVEARTRGVLRPRQRQADGHCAGGAGVGGGVHPRTAIQRVVPRPALQPVVAAQAQQRVVAGAAGQGVVAGGAREQLVAGTQGGCSARPVGELQELDAADGVVAVAAGHAVDDSEALRDGVVGHRVVREVASKGNGVDAGIADDRVVAGAAQQRVVAAAADQRVVAAQAFQRVVATVAGDQIVEVTAAADVLDIGQRVRGAVAVLCHAGGQIDVDARSGAQVVHPIYTALAVDQVVALAALERLEGTAVTAGQRVVEGRAANALDIDQGVGAAEAVAGSAVASAAERDVHASGAGVVVGTVVAGAAVDGVVAGAAQEPLQPVAAAGAVGRVAAGERVVESAAAHAFDVEQRVGVAVTVLRGAGGEVDIDGRGSEVVAHLVVAALAVDRVVAGAPFEDLVDVGAVAAGQRVVEVAAAELADVDQRVGAYAGCRAGAQIGVHGAGRVVVSSAVGIGAIERVGDRTAVDRVVAERTLELLEDQVCAAGDRVVEVRAAEEGDIADLVGAAEAVADDAGGAVQADRARRRDVVDEVAVAVVDAVEDGPAVERVVAGAAHQRVGAGAAQDAVVAVLAAQVVVAAVADDGVVAASALDVVGAVVAFQRVGEVRATQVLDADEGVIAPRAGRGVGHEADIHRAGRAEVVRRAVDAGAAVEGVVAAVATQEVATGITDQQIVAATA